MPIPGGAYALQQSLRFYPRSRPRSNSLGLTTTFHDDDPHYQEYKQAQRHFCENLKMNIGFYKEIIPSTLGNLSGLLVLETKEEITHCGVFILMKGFSVPPNKRRQRATKVDGAGPLRNPVSSLKFTVLGNISGKGEDMIVEAGSKESYPLELELPQSREELPPPLVTSEGRLQYQFQAFMTTSEGRHVKVGETTMPYQGYYDLSKNCRETQKPIRISQDVQSKRSYLGLGRKKTVSVELSVEKRGFLPQEYINFVVVGSGQDIKTEVQLECKVELVQKVWYQVLSNVGKRLSVRMKVNLVAITSLNKLLVEPGYDAVWDGSLLIPRGQTPTYKFDFMNSISYTLRATFSLNGDKEGRVTGEAPIYIGISCGDDEEERVDDGDGVDNDQAGANCLSKLLNDGVDEDDTSPPRFCAGVPLRPSQSMTFIPRRRAGSLASVDSAGSSTSSFLRMPPSYSQLSSRRSTLETLPPPYCELELQEKCCISENEDLVNDKPDCEEVETKDDVNADADADAKNENDVSCQDRDPDV